MRFLPILFSLIIATLVVVFHTYVRYNSEAIVTNKQDAVLNEARLHFENLLNTRKWNAQYDGVYVKPAKDLKPNPYLKENILHYDANRSLIRINPAWMTRQLSEIETIDNLHFTITSLNPINPANAPDAFEKEGLEYINTHHVNEYYRFDTSGNDFHFIGALRITQACLSCHDAQHYKVGDLRGGIHIMLNNTGVGNFVTTMQERKTMVLSMAYGLGFMLMAVVFYAHRKHAQTEELNRSLETKVAERTQSLRQKQSILQEMLDRQPDGILLMEGTKIIDTNRSFQNLCKNLMPEDSSGEHVCTFDKRIIPVDKEHYIRPYMNDQHWSEYILHHSGTFKVKLDLPEGDVVFELSAKVLELESGEQLKLVSLSDVTQHEILVENLKRSALTDTLTGVYNRKKFDDELSSCLTVRLELNIDISLIMIDIDFFKSVNDTYGHATGDALLKHFAGHIASLVREQDFIARWGGEEFIVILYHTSEAHALEVAEKLRRNVETHTYEHNLKITASFGVTQMRSDDTAQSVLERVDRALYRSKQEGRNRVNIL